MTIEVSARLKTKTIKSVDLYVNNQLLQSLTEPPYTYSYTPTATGKYDLKAVVTATDDSQYERYSGFTALDGFVPQTGVTATVGKRFTSLAEIGSQPFAIVNEQESKALYCSDNQNLAYDSYQKAFTASVSGYYFRIESLKNYADASIRNYYFLRLIKPDLNEYSIWGKPGYLNSQPVDGGWCSFILGLTQGNGEDMKNGAVWDVQYVEGKGFTLKNVATGLYLHDATPAKYEDPVYFTFCTLVTDTSVKSALQDDETDGAVYDLSGRRVSNSKGSNSQLKKGLYIRNGKKFQVSR